MRLLKRKASRRKKKKNRRNYVERASHMRRTRFFLHRAVMISSIVMFIGLLAWGGWFWQSGRAGQAMVQINAWVDNVSVNMGLTLQDVYLEGQEHTDSDEILASLQVNIGEPLLRLPIAEIRERLEHLMWVDYAVISRQLPHTLHVRIVEREAVAIWQNAGQLYLIDREGKIIVEDDVKPFANLVIMVGNEAPLYTRGLMQMIHAEPELAARVVSAVRVGERRWNIRFMNGVEAKLPEADAKSAWHFLYQLQQQYKVLDDGRKTIDLRVPDKVYIQTSPDDKGKKTTPDRI